MKNKEPAISIGSFRKVNSCGIKIIVAITVSTLVCLIGYYLSFERPRYTILTIPSPLSYLGERGDWSTTEYSDMYWRENPNAHYYIWRKVTQAHDTTFDPEHGFPSWEAVIQYFDQWLVDQGWILYEDNSFDPCRSYLPESNFLPRGTNGYVIYRQENTLRFAAEPTVCLAVWPIDPLSDPVKTYNVVMITVTPSLFRQWQSQINLVPDK